jgi:starvation-inducible DNA-binding protein
MHMFPTPDPNQKKIYCGGDLETALNICLGNLVNLTTRAQAFHWSVEGPEFHQYHQFFQIIYEDLHQSIDGFAENILMSGYSLPMSLKNMLSYSTLQCDDVEPTPESLSRSLYESNKKCLEEYAATIGLAESFDKDLSFISAQADLQKKWDWQLRSIIKDADVPSPTSVTHINVDIEVEDESEKSEALDRIFRQELDPNSYDLMLASAVEPGDDSEESSQEATPGDETTITSAGGHQAPAEILFDPRTEEDLEKKVEKFNERAPSDKKLSFSTLKAVYRRGALSYPDVNRSGKSRDVWAMDRANAFMRLLSAGKSSNPAYTHDNDLLPPSHPEFSRSEATIIASGRSITNSTDYEEYIRAQLQPDIRSKVSDYTSVSDAILSAVEVSGLGYGAEVAFKAAWMRAINEGSDPYARVQSFAAKTYNSVDADLLPEKESGERHG